MSTTVSPTDTSPVFSSEHLTIIVASFSCLVFFVVIVVLLSLLFRKDPFCCKARAYRASRGDLEAPSQYYSSRQTLVSSSCTELPGHDSNSNTQSGPLFYVGLPSSYRLPPLEPPLPRLPSYESVRKKDRQRQIHMMIADRFGLNGPLSPEPPPTYEETIRQSLQSLDVPLDPETPTSPSSSPPMDGLPPYEALPHTATSPDHERTCQSD